MVQKIFAQEGLIIAILTWLYWSWLFLNQSASQYSIPKIGITKPLNSRSWLNFFSKLLLVRKVKSGALIGQKWVKLERELRPSDPNLSYSVKL